MAKRAFIACYDALCALALSCVLVCAWAPPAFAYIDPSVMTYTIQAVAGVAVALSTVLGVALRRGRRGLMALLDIDENARREVEPEVHRVSPDGNVVPNVAVAAGGGEGAGAADAQPGATDAGEGAAGEQSGAAASVQLAAGVSEGAGAADAGEGAAAGAPDVQAGVAEHVPEGPAEGAPEKARPFGKRLRGGVRARGGARAPYRPSWKERLAFGAVVGFFFAFTVYFVAPLEIVSGASSDLVFSMGDVWWVPVGPSLGIAAGIAAVLAVLRGRAFSMALVLVCAVGLCAYVQALCLNFGLPAADGNTIVWIDYLPQVVVSTVVWVALIAAAVAFSLVRAKRAAGLAAIVSVFLVLVQGVGLASLAVSAAVDDGAGGAGGAGAGASGGKVLMTEDQLFTVNADHNVIVFILDTYDTAYLSRVLDMNPGLLDGLTGFTNYENATSAMIPTRFAIPEMLTGQMPSFTEPFSTYKAQRYARSDYLQRIYDANYSIGLYTDSLRISALPAAEQNALTSKTVNMHDMPGSAMDFGGTLYSLYQMGQYRDVPWLFKWAFWYYTDQINQSMVATDEAGEPDQTIYVMDDIRYYNRLRQFGLSLEEDGHDGAFRFIHLLGSHYPFTYDEEVNDLGEDNSDVFRQSQGAIHIVTTYIDKLKELGVYENTTIIVTADHGYWTITLDPIEETSTPIMFVKPEQSAEADARPIAVDEKPVSHLDLQATVLDAMGLDWSEYAERDEWAGYSMFGYIDPARVRYYLTTDSLPDLTETQFREYRITGNALQWENWEETGRTINAQE